jgi:transglutaminase-like putative cysteine protease
MSIHVALHHRTRYRYERPVSLGPQSVRLRPAPHCRTRILSYALDVTPKEHFLNWQQDPQSNYIARLVFPNATNELTIDVDLVAEMAAMNPFDFFLEPSAEKWPFEYEPALAEELAPYKRTLPATPLFDSFLDSISRDRRSTNDFLVELNRRLNGEIEYRVRLEPGLQTPEETLSLRSGSCRDSGWLLVQVLRRLGFAARFVSGYLIQLTADEKPLDGPAGPTSDFVDLHAWCEVYLPGAGWIGLDPTSGLLAGEGHLPLACTAEPSLAAPVSGLVERCETEFTHEMKVTRIFEVPRVTKPYSEAEWQRVVDLGRSIDSDLAKGDVRLTMGGEPTFVAAGDLEADEWNTAALGPTKRKLATELFFRLRDRYAPNGLVHFGQGKWYPGEPLPRWALNLYWRRDGDPLWKDPALLADESAPSGADADSARRLLEAVAAKLGLDSNNVLAAYEDVLYYLWRERRLPINVDPLASKLDDPLERARLTRLFDEGLGKAVGYVLPIASKDGFRSTPWHFRGGRCFLVPGDSPVGLRLPLDTLPWVAPADREIAETLDPSVEPPALPARSQLGEAPRKETDRPVPKAWAARTAMCAEPRKGVLYVFMPPFDRVEDYIALVAAVEDDRHADRRRRAMAGSFTSA